MPNTKLNYLAIIFVSIVFMSCKQSLFLKRRYTNGIYFSKSGSVDLKNVHESHATSHKVLTRSATAPLSTEHLSDTLLLNNGKRISCKVQTVERKQITFTCNGTSKVIRSADVAQINYEGHQKEFISKYDSEGNPLLQFGLVHGQKKSRGSDGMAIFGYVITLITGAILIPAAPLFGFPFFLLHLSLLIAHEVVNYESVGFKVLNGIGKFYGWLFIITLGLMLLLLLILIASL